MYEVALVEGDLINPPQPDTLSSRSHPDNRPTKDGSVLRSTSEIEGHSCICGWNYTHTSTMAPSGLPD